MTWYAFTEGPSSVAAPSAGGPGDLCWPLLQDWSGRANPRLRLAGPADMARSGATWLTCDKLVAFAAAGGWDQAWDHAVNVHLTWTEWREWWGREFRGCPQYLGTPRRASDKVINSDVMRRGLDKFKCTADLVAAVAGGHAEGYMGATATVQYTPDLGSALPNLRRAAELAVGLRAGLVINTVPTEQDRPDRFKEAVAAAGAPMPGIEYTPSPVVDCDMRLYHNTYEAAGSKHRGTRDANGFLVGRYA